MRFIGIIPERYALTRFFYSHLILLMLINQISVQAKTFGNNITVHDGLAHYSVQTIVQDKYGFIWFGTLNGLTRYDGYNLKNYQLSPTDSNSISNNRIQLIYSDNNDDMWISTFDSIICKYNYQTDNFTRYLKKNVSEEVKDSTDRFINKSRQYACGAGKEFLIEENKFLIIKDKSTGNEIDIKEILPDDIEKLDFNCVFIDKSNVLWIGTNYYGVLKIDLMANRFNPVNYRIAIRCIFKNNNNLWLGTFENGIIVKDLLSGTNRTYSATKPSEKHIASDNTRFIYKDYLNNIWIAYNTGVDCIESKTGRLKQMTPRGNITRYDKDVWKQMQTLPNRNYFCIAEDKANTLWLGSYNGILKYNRQEDTFSYIDLSQYANGSIITCILSDSKDNLWAGSVNGGIFCLKRDVVGNEWKVFQHFHFQYGNPNSLPDDRVYSVQEDADGFIWVGTENGLCRINPNNESITTYNQTNGLSDNGIACLLIDNHNQLWISHKKGISKMDTKTLSVKNYNVPAIEKNGYFLTCSGYYDKDEDHLYFGYTEGYIQFSPLDIHDNSIVPIPQLVDLRINNQSIHVNQLINDRIILKQPLYNTPDITLTYKEKSISIEFTGIHFANPELNHFKYMLEGFNEDWITTNADNRLATYSNLKPGNYTFKVKVSNASDLWGPEVAELQINVQTPWWVTWWAYAIYSCIAIGLLYLFISMLLSKQKVEHLFHVEKLKADQLQEIERIRSSFFTNISHELRTPLTLILDPIKRMITKSDDPQENLRREIIKRNAERLLTLVNELLDVRKAEEGRLTLNLQPIDLYSLIENVKTAFILNTENRSITIDFVSTLKQLTAIIDRDRMETVLYNLLSNAVKNSEDDSRITIRLNIKDESIIELSIQNKGKTIEPDELISIFDPFYQASTGNNSDIKGTGLGLTITRQIIELHGGKINVSSNNGLTTFTIQLPYVSSGHEPITNIAAVYPKQDINTPLNIESERITQSDEELPLVLLIEDNSDIRQYIQSELHTRFNIMEAADGETGIEIAKTTIPDLIISDVMMPGMSGYEVCAEIKNDMRTFHILVILLTARQSEESYIQGYETGADSYITKPFSIQVLETRIINLLNNRKRLMAIHKETDKSQVSQVDHTGIEPDFLKELKSRILNSDKMYNVEILAESMHMSRSQLYRKIKELTGQSASDFISEVRMNDACRLLKEGKYNISEIALKLGYSEQANFSRSFFRYFGKYPTQYLSDIE